MGSSSGITRGQLRPHFAGRNPPFIVAALCVGLGILGVSYYSLSSQFTTLQMQLETLVKNEESNRNAFEEKIKDYDVLQKNIEQLRGRLELKENEVKVKDTDIEKLKKSQEQFETNLRSEKSHLQEENKALSDKNVQLQKSLDEANAEDKKLKSQIDSLEKTLTEKETDIAKLTVKVDELTKKASDGGVVSKDEKKSDNAVNKDVVNSGQPSDNVKVDGKEAAAAAANVKNNEANQINADDSNSKHQKVSEASLQNNDAKASLPKPNINLKADGANDEGTNTDYFAANKLN